MDGIIILSLLVLLILQGAIHYFERKDLYNRIMSDNIYDYKSVNEKNKKNAESGHKRVLKRWRGEE